MLGEGTWGETYSAEQVTEAGVAMPVAVKRLAKAKLSDTAALQAFRQQCELMAPPRVGVAHRPRTSFGR